MATFKYLRCHSLDEAIDLLATHARQARILAGGTDLLVSIRDGLESPRYLIDIKPIAELHTLALEDGLLRIGASVTVNQLIDFEHLPAGMDAITEAASCLASYQIRNRATVGGNICNASPACDLGPPLLVLGAKVETISKRGRRTIPIEDFFEDVKVTRLEPDEIVTAILIPSPRGGVSTFLKRSRIKGHDLAVVNAAGAVTKDGNLRMAFGAVAPTPILVDDFNGARLDDTARIVDVLMNAISPIDDVRASAVYRKYMVEALAKKILETLMNRLQG